MNQILNYIDEDNNENNLISHSKKTHKKYVLFLRFQFLISVIALVIAFGYYLYSVYDNFQKEAISKQVTDNFNITTLYNRPEEYEAQRVILENSYSYIGQEAVFSVVGIIEIKKIGITYPILSTINDDLLKIAPCKFYGPNPNEIGNCCIAGHNYNDSKFFGKIPKLRKNDKITIYDTFGNSIQYVVYKNYEVSANDWTSTSQETNGKREITLVTCNNLNSKRIIIKAKEMNT